MRNFLIYGFCVLLSWTSASAADRLYVNDKKTPETLKDLEVIQSALIAALPKTRAATVCIQFENGSGTGVVITPEGLVLSAAHVTAGVGRMVKLKFEDGTEVDAKTLGLDSDRDAAMLQISDNSGKKWPCVEIDRDESAHLGDWVFALGHSGGFNLERGLVVRLGRLVRFADATFQSDCILIGGDSGGPLFDLSGKLVAIHSRVGNAAQENMHVPIAQFLKNWDDLLGSKFLGEGPFATRPVKGSGFLGLASEARPEGGIVITKVGKSSPAEKAGLKVGDVLLKANQQVLSKREDLQNMLKEMATGDEIIFEMLRDGKSEPLTIKLGER